jgi:hypothetical protein
MAVNLSGLNPTGLLVFALVSAIAYYVIRNYTPNKFVALAIGVAMLLFLGGSLQTVGLGLTALSVSKLVDQDIGKLISS